MQEDWIYVVTTVCLFNPNYLANKKYSQPINLYFTLTPLTVFESPQYEWSPACDQNTFIYLSASIWIDAQLQIQKSVHYWLTALCASPSLSLQEVDFPALKHHDALEVH